MDVTAGRTNFVLGEGVSFDSAPLLYNSELDAFLIKMNRLSGTLGEFVQDHTAHVTSIVKDSSDGTLYDWNNNIYRIEGAWDKGLALHVNNAVTTVANRQVLCDVSAWDGGDFPACDHSYTTAILDWIPAPVGVAGLLGYPATTSLKLAKNESVVVFSGIAKTVRGGNGSALVTSSGEGALQFSIIHATHVSAWLQSSGFAFKALAGSSLDTSTSTRPSLRFGGALASFDWEQFFRNVGLQNADDWLTIAIIAVLNILPRIFMFMFVILMALAVISDVKPWRIFCDKVIDPYKILTFGRQDVHTIRLRTVFLYSIIALALFGLFQNGLILDVIAWIARAVTGILGR
jgi:hypothetical protein